MSEALPYIVLAGSVAAVFVGVGIKIVLERASEEPVLSVGVSASVAGEAPVVHEVPAPATSEGPSAAVGEGEVKSSREVVGLGSSVGSDGEVVTAGRSESKRRKRRKVGKRLERKIVRLYRKGKSPKEIAEELGISTSTVYRKLRKLMSVKS